MARVVAVAVVWWWHGCGSGSGVAVVVMVVVAVAVAMALARVKAVVLAVTVAVAVAREVARMVVAAVVSGSGKSGGSPLKDKILIWQNILYQVRAMGTQYQYNLLYHTTQLIIFNMKIIFSFETVDIVITKKFTLSNK